MATIDKNSITVTKTADESVYRIDFDFTDSTSLNVNEGWKVTWLHGNFMAGSTATAPEFNAGALSAMADARRPTREINLETALRGAYGSAVIRTDPNPVESTNYQKFQLAAISNGVIMKVST